MKWYPTEDSDQVVCRFATEQRLDVLASREQNDEVYKDVTVLYMKNVGSDDTICFRLDKGEYQDKIKRCMTAYRAFMEGEEPDEGTPLENLKTLPPEKAAAWRLMGIHTLEQVANLSDSALDRLGMGARSFQRKAQEQLTAPAKNQPDAAVGQNPEKRKPGRPPKREQAA